MYLIFLLEMTILSICINSYKIKVIIMECTVLNKKQKNYAIKLLIVWINDKIKFTVDNILVMQYGSYTVISYPSLF